MSGTIGKQLIRLSEHRMRKGERWRRRGGDVETWRGEEMEMLREGEVDRWIRGEFERWRNLLVFLCSGDYQFMGKGSVAGDFPHKPFDFT